MKLLTYLAVFVCAATASAATKGYPVFRMLKQNVYDFSWGTGFAVQYEGQKYLVTNWHICRHYKSSTAVRRTSTNKIESTNIIASFPLDDLCLLTAGSAEGLEVGGATKKGNAVYTAGYPADAKGRLVKRAGVTTTKSHGELDFEHEEPCLEGFTEGKDSKGTPSCKHAFHVQDTTLIGMEGCSGSPVVNSRGKLVGIVNQKDGTHLSYIPVSALVKILKSLKPKGP